MHEKRLAVEKGTQRNYRFLSLVPQKTILIQLIQNINVQTKGFIMKDRTCVKALAGRTLQKVHA
jgi:hypothetical protein